MSSIIEMIQKNDLLKLVLVAVAVYFFVVYYKKETLENTPEETVKVQESQIVQGTQQLEDAQIQKIVKGDTQLKAEELLPKYDDANEFAKQNPVSNLLKEANFLIAGQHIGVNTVMQSNKIPYHDIRSVPPILKESVSPFNNSSYEAPVGSGRRTLEIGA